MSETVLCLDQSTKATGYCVIEDNKYKSSGVLLLSKKDKEYSDSIEKLEEMNGYIVNLINRVKPNHVVFEGVQYQNNFSTYNILSRLQGVIMADLFNYDIGFTIIEPTAWKACCKIKGRKRIEQKKNTQLFVKNIYGIDVGEDEADSIGIATWSMKNLKKQSKDS